MYIYLQEYVLCFFILKTQYETENGAEKLTNNAHLSIQASSWQLAKVLSLRSDRLNWFFFLYTCYPEPHVS